MIVLTKLLTLFFWLGVAALLLFINRIARFYQMTTGVRSYYRFFLVPVFFFLAGMGRYLVVERGFAGDVLGDTLFFLGAVSLSFTGYVLLRLMTGGR
jgi:hypothetical protein